MDRALALPGQARLDPNAIVSLLAAHPETHRVLREQLTSDVMAQAFMMHLLVALELNRDVDKSPRQVYKELNTVMRDSLSRRRITQVFTQGIKPRSDKSAITDGNPALELFP